MVPLLYFIKNTSGLTMFHCDLFILIQSLIQTLIRRLACTQLQCIVILGCEKMSPNIPEIDGKKVQYTQLDSVSMPFTNNN